ASRRRHTSLSRDWSSDVCSSDLNNIYQFPVGEKTLETYRREVRNTRAKLNRILKQHNIDLSNEIPIPDLESFRSRKEFNEWTRKIGRASCRERAKSRDGAVALDT